MLCQDEFVVCFSILSPLTNSKIICKLQPLGSQHSNGTSTWTNKWKIATLTAECAHVHACPQGHGNLRGLLIQPAPSLPSLINLPPIYFAKGSFSLHTCRWTEIHSHTNGRDLRQTWQPVLKMLPLNFQCVQLNLWYNLSSFSKHSVYKISLHRCIHVWWEKPFLCGGVFSAPSGWNVHCSKQINEIRQEQKYQIGVNVHFWPFGSNKQQ